MSLICCSRDMASIDQVSHCLLHIPCFQKLKTKKICFHGAAQTSRAVPWSTVQTLEWLRNDYWPPVLPICVRLLQRAVHLEQRPAPAHATPLIHHQALGGKRRESCESLRSEPSETPAPLLPQHTSKITDDKTMWPGFTPPRFPFHTMNKKENKKHTLSLRLARANRETL